MSISGDAYTAPLQSIEASSNFEVQKNVPLLKKANDQITQQGQALTEMIEAVPTPSSRPGGLDTYA